MNPYFDKIILTKLYVSVFWLSDMHTNQTLHFPAVENGLKNSLNKNQEHNGIFRVHW